MEHIETNKVKLNEIFLSSFLTYLSLHIFAPSLNYMVSFPFIPALIFLAITL